MTNITIVEDQMILLDSLSAAIDAEDDFDVVARLTDAAAIHASVKAHPTDIVLMDIMTENSSGLEEAAKLRKQYPDLKIVIVTAMPDASFVSRARAAGVDSFVYKNVSTIDLVALLRATLRGEGSFPGECAGDVGLSDLSEREVEMLRWVCAGLSRREIAKKMFLSENTVKSYISSMLTKTGFSSAARLALWAVSSGYVVVEKPGLDIDGVS